MATKKVAEEEKAPPTRAERIAALEEVRDKHEAKVKELDAEIAAVRTEES